MDAVKNTCLKPRETINHAVPDHHTLCRCHGRDPSGHGDCRELEPEEVTYHNRNGQEYLTYRYPNGILLYHDHPGMENLQVVGTPGEKKAPKTVPEYKGSGGIYGDFIECVKTRQRPFRDIELATHTIAVAHLGGIAYQLKRSLKWDAAKQEFPGDEEANRLIDRARREPWTL